MTNSYNNRLQPTILSAAAPSQTVLSLSYDFHLGTADNGNVYAIQNNRDATRSEPRNSQPASAWMSGKHWSCL